MNKQHLIWSNIAFDPLETVVELEEICPYKTTDELIELTYLAQHLRLIELRKALFKYVGPCIYGFGYEECAEARRPVLIKIEPGMLADCFLLRWDQASWYIDAYGDLRCDAISSTGVGHYRFRAVKDSLSRNQLLELEAHKAGVALKEYQIKALTNGLGTSIFQILNLK